MNKQTIEVLHKTAEDIRARKDMTEDERQAAICLLIAADHLAASDRKREVKIKHEKKAPAEAPAKVA